MEAVSVFSSPCRTSLRAGSTASVTQTNLRAKIKTDAGDAALSLRYPMNARVAFVARANCRAWKRAVQCNIMNNGTIYAGMSTRGNCAMGPVVTLPISPVIPGIKPEQTVPIDTATTKSTIPRIFQLAYRRLAANNGLRIKARTIHGAVTPIAMSPSPAGKAKSPGKIPLA